MDDYETIQRRRNIIVGIFVVVALLAMAYLVYKFGDLPIFVSRVKSFKVFVQFPTAQGVEKDTPVRFCGYQIGRVIEVKPPKVMKDSQGRFYHQTLAVLAIDRKYSDIPDDVNVKLMTRGLGSSYIELELTHFDVTEPTGPFLTEGTTLQGSTGVTSEFFPEESQKKLDELVDNLKILIANANDVIGDPNNKENLKKTLANLTVASEEFRKFAVAGTTTLKNADARAQELVAAMVSTSEQLSEAAVQLRLILEKINTGDGTAARLINDGRFYENLLENTEQMQALLEELRSFVTQAREKGVRIKLR